MVPVDICLSPGLVPASAASLRWASVGEPALLGMTGVQEVGLQSTAWNPAGAPCWPGLGTCLTLAVHHKSPSQLRQGSTVAPSLSACAPPAPRIEISSSAPALVLVPAGADCITCGDPSLRDRWPACALNVAPAPDAPGWVSATKCISCHTVSALNLPAKIVVPTSSQGPRSHRQQPR